MNMYEIHTNHIKSYHVISKINDKYVWSGYGPLYFCLLVFKIYMLSVTIYKCNSFQKRLILIGLLSGRFTAR